MAETKEVPFGGYGFAIRTFWIEGSNLSVSRRWAQYFEADPSSGVRNREELFSTSIVGDAICEKDKVCEIGSTRQVTEFTLTIRPEMEVREVADDLFESNDESADGSTPESRLSLEIAKQCSKWPATATLFVLKDDWEIGSEGGWFLDCAVPKNVFDKLESEVRSNVACNVRLGIKWIAGLVKDKYAPPSVPTSWGLFKVPGRATPEPLCGHTTFVTWSVQSQEAERTRSLDRTK